MDIKLWEGLVSYLWNPWLLILFFLVGGYYSIRTGFFQFFEWKQWVSSTIGLLFRKKKKQGKHGRLTQLQAMVTSLGATVGTSSIAGVATAIFFGGPGAVFWMWASALLGMMTGYAEKVLAIYYRSRDKNGAWKGGPQEYMKKGLGWPVLAKMFSFACLCASFSGGNLVQVNSIASGMQAAFAVPPQMIDLIVAGFVALVILGGIERIGKVSSTLVPVMAFCFVIGSFFVLFVHYQAIPMAFADIFKGACDFDSAVAGISGYGVVAAVRYGVARGVFTNEAGLGSSAMAHAVADVENPHTQGLWGILEVFLATMVIATMSALVILTSGIYQKEGALYAIENGLSDTSMIGVPLVVRSFETAMGEIGAPFLVLCLTLFAISSIIGWSYYGERCIEELGGKKQYQNVSHSISAFACCWKYGRRKDCMGARRCL